MAARAIWKATLRLGRRSVAVKLYAAIEDAKVHFRLLHRTDKQPVSQQMVDADTGQPVPRESLRKGVALDGERYVLLSGAELESLVPEPSRDITVLQVVDAGRLDRRLLDRPYYLGPDGDAGAYFALAAALESRRALLVAGWVMRKRRHAGAIHASDGYLLLETAHRAAELATLTALKPAADRRPVKREIALAEQLIATLEGEFDATAYRDEYSQAVRRLIGQKRSGKLVRLPAAKRQRKPGSLVADLEASLEARRKVAGGN